MWSDSEKGFILAYNQRRLSPYRTHLFFFHQYLIYFQFIIAREEGKNHTIPESTLLLISVRVIFILKLFKKKIFKYFFSSFFFIRSRGVLFRLICIFIK